jgi:hypothetical protein
MSYFILENTSEVYAGYDILSTTKDAETMRHVMDVLLLFGMIENGLRNCIIDARGANGLKGGESWRFPKLLLSFVARC